MKTDNNTLDINEEIREDSRPTEIPVISIERDNGDDDGRPDGPSQRKRRYRRRIMASLAAALVLLLLGGLLLFHFRYELMSPDLPASVSDEDNISLLEAPYSPSAEGTAPASDSILGVAMDFYPLDGLRASLEKELPDTADRSLILFMRSADYHPGGSPIGPMVVNGESLEAKERESRMAYMAISPDGRPVIGVSHSDRMRRYATETGGSFFRQYVLLSDGTLPADFRLHGKVERAAIGRMADGSLHYIVTRHKETMYDFADAMREYGVVDAMYITGGNAYTFYRDSSGAPHINDATREKISKYSSTPLPLPLLVFRKGDSTAYRTYQSSY